MPLPDSPSSLPVSSPTSGQALRLGRYALWLSLLALVAWALFAPIDEGIPAAGLVTVDTKRKAVQHLQGGIVREVHVSEGALVKEGQLLMALEQSNARANYESVRQHYLAWRTSESRLLAERSGAAGMGFHPDILATQGDPLVRQHMDTQAQLFRSRRQALQTSLKVLAENRAGLQEQASAQQLRSARRVFELGQGTRTDIDEAQARFDQAQMQSVQARQNRDYARRQMALLVGQEVASLMSVPADAAAPPEIAGSLDHWLSLARSGNPDLQIARSKLALAELEVSRAEAGHHPTLDLIGQRSLSKSENTQFPNSSYASSQIGVQLNLPIFSGGAVSSAVRQAVASREREVFIVEQVGNELALKVQREVHSLQEGDDRLRAARQALLSAAQLVVSTTKGVQAGTRTVLDTLNAAQREAEARRELALVHYQLQLSRLRLAALCGEDLQASVELVNRQLQASQ